MTPTPRALPGKPSSRCPASLPRSFPVTCGALRHSPTASPSAVSTRGSTVPVALSLFGTVRGFHTCTAISWCILLLRPRRAPALASCSSLVLYSHTSSLPSAVPVRVQRSEERMWSERYRQLPSAVPRWATWTPGRPGDGRPSHRPSAVPWTRGRPALSMPCSGVGLRAMAPPAVVDAQHCRTAEATDVRHSRTAGSADARQWPHNRLPRQ